MPVEPTTVVRFVVAYHVVSVVRVGLVRPSSGRPAYEPSWSSSWRHGA